MVSSATIEVYLIIAIGMIVVLLFSGFIVLFVIIYQKRMLAEKVHRQELEGTLQQRILQATLESQEAERKSMSVDLHDSIGGMLSAVRIGLATVSRQMEDPKKMSSSIEMLDETIESVRRISRELMPATLEKFGLLAGARELVEKLQATSSIQMSMVTLGASRALGNNREIMIYRIAQELLNNAIKHSKATFIEVVFNYQSKLILTIDDNGVGMDPKNLELHRSSSLGMYNIQSRVQLLHAEIVADPEKTEGTRIIVTIPYE